MNRATVFNFESQFEVLLQAGAKDLIRDFNFVTLPSNTKPWLDTGITLAASDGLSSFATGQTHFKDLSICLEPNFQIWFRIGMEGEIFRGTRDSHSFTAEQPGRLYLASYFPGEWANKTGAVVTPDAAYDIVTGDFTVLLIRWQNNALESLR